MNLKVFISGATGFVGRHLISRLNSPQYTIYGSSFPEKPEVFEGLGGREIFHLDIRAEEDIFEVIRRVQPDWVFHLAAISNVKHSWEERRETLETNILGTLNLFEAVRKHAQKARVLFVSSSDVYGIISSGERVLKEEDDTRAVNPYALTKIGGEILSKFYWEIEKLDVLIVRSFPHTGPGQGPDFACSDWACQIARIEKGLAEPVIKVGNIDIQRDYTDVRDVVKAYVSLMERGKKGQTYNICSGKAVALRKILEFLCSLSSESVKVKVDSRKLRKTDIPFLVGNNRKIRRETSWEPKIPLEQTLKDLLEYWRKREGST